MKDAPTFDGVNGITFNPVRLMFMMGTVWRLARDSGGRALDILEVGSWTGASALCWGHGLALYNQAHGRITCVDSWQPFVDLDANPGDVHAIMGDALANGTIYETFCRNMTFLPDGVEHTTLRGLSDDILPSLPQRSFDLVYIDGDHSYGAVRRDIAHAMDLVADGGILCGDDLEAQANEVNAEIARANPTLDYVFATHLERLYHPGVTLAVGELLGPVSAWEGFWAMRKREAAWEPVSLSGMPFDIPPYLPSGALIGLKTFLMKNGLL